MEFGKSLLPLFAMEQGYININSASVGLEPIHITQKRYEYMAQINQSNEKWFRYKLKEEILKSREAIGEFVGCKANELALVHNATEAFQDVLSAVDWKEGDTILYTNVAYLAMRHQIRHLALVKKLNAVEIVLTKEIINDQTKLLKTFEDVMIEYKNKNLRAFAFDHISSNPSFIWPVKAISDLCKKYNCLSICDGAQAAGHITLNIHSYGVDYYISNMHKWGFTPRPFAFTFIKESLQQGAHPSVIGNYYGKGYVEEFNGKGTNDPSPYLTATDALAFRKMLGEERIQSYCRNLAYKAGQIFAEQWGTSVLFADKELYGNLVTVEIPHVKKLSDMYQIVTELLYKENFYLVHFEFDGKLYVRISANIYNDESDYIHCSEVALKYIKSFVEKQSS